MERIMEPTFLSWGTISTGLTSKFSSTAVSISWGFRARMIGVLSTAARDWVVWVWVFWVAINAVRGMAAVKRRSVNMLNIFL